MNSSHNYSHTSLPDAPSSVPDTKERAAPKLSTVPRGHWRNLWRSSTDGDASLRHNDRLSECCALLGTRGIAPEDLHKWSDVLDLGLANPPAQVGERT